MQGGEVMPSQYGVTQRNVYSSQDSYRSPGPAQPDIFSSLKINKQGSTQVTMAIGGSLDRRGPVASVIGK